MGPPDCCRDTVGAVMRLLAIETATDLVGSALLSDVQPGDQPGSPAVVERSHLGGRVHAELLAPSIEEVCALAGCLLTEVDALAVDIGPGLFTGLRVGVGTAKALGQSLGLDIVGVTSLDVLAAGAFEAVAGGDRPDRARRVVSVVDARRSEVFAASYAMRAATEDPANTCRDQSEPLTPDALIDWLDELVVEASPILVVGDGAVRYLDLLAPRPGLDLGLAESVATPSPAVLARLAARRLAAGAVAQPAGDLVPDYRRPPDAKINWEERAPQRVARPEAGTP